MALCHFTQLIKCFERGMVLQCSYIESQLEFKRMIGLLAIGAKIRDKIINPLHVWIIKNSLWCT